MSKPRKSKRIVTIKSRFGYFGGMTISPDKPIKWTKSLRMSRRLSVSEACAIRKSLEIALGYDRLDDELEIIDRGVIKRA